MKFDNVVTNIGNAYHALSGNFIAPIDGEYMFFATVCGCKNSIGGQNFVRFLHNGKRLTELRVSSYDQSSQMFILRLRADDEIKLINNVANDLLFGEAYSSFSGLLLSSP